MGEATEQLSAEDLRRQLDQQRADLGRDLEMVGDKVSPGRIVERRRAALRDTIFGAKERVLGVADSATSRVGDTTGAIGDRFGEAPAPGQVVEGNPMAVGLIAFGAGALLATLLPTSEKEQRFADEKAMPALRSAAEEAGTVAAGAVEELKPVAQEAVESVKGTAQDAAQSVKDDAKGAADSVKSEAKGAADEVKNTAQP